MLEVVVVMRCLVYLYSRRVVAGVVLVVVVVVVVDVDVVGRCVVVVVVVFFAGLPVGDFGSTVFFCECFKPKSG